MDFSAIPPAGGYPPFYKFIKHLLTRPNLRLEKIFKQEVLLDTCSGKSALYAVFLALKKVHSASKVLVPSYSCPDIVIAASNAGFKVELAPVSQDTLQINKEHLLSLSSGEYAAVVFANLYGITDQIPQGMDPEILIIDDLCQALLSKKNFQKGISVISASRGKSICGIGGGGVLYKEGNPLADKIYPHIKSEIQNWPKHNLIEEIKFLLISFLIPKLEHPKLFYLLCNFAPFLRLGEVRFNFNFISKRISFFQSAFAAYQYLNSNSNNPWSEKIPTVSEIYLNRGFKDGMHLIRYPVRVNSQSLRDVIVKDLKSLGVSASYVKSLMEYRELEEKISYSSELKPIIGLMTLPVHKYVNQQVVRKIRDYLINIEGKS